MCGIAGVLSLTSAPPDAAAVAKSIELLAHRGPDGSGLLTRPKAVLGHRRLAIIDLAGSPQPMSTPDERLHLTFNGEIFNYRELRARLHYTFRTAGDTETLLAAHKEFGETAVTRLEGQFAYALYDERAGELWLHRDRLGILPLYYYADAERFAFASEIKALLPLMGRQPEVDESSLDAYLARRSVPAPRTLFKNVRKVEAGTSVRCSPTGDVTVTRYWDLPEPLRGNHGVTAAMDVERLHGEFEAAVRRNLVADVPVGAYLSGGVDSSLIVALASRLHDGPPLETFAAGFGDPRHDELAHARFVSSMFATTHHEVNVRADDFESLWEPLTWHRDGPISEASDVAVYMLAKLASQHVKAVLSGEGSDELFGGYPKAAFAGLTRAVGVVPEALRGPALTFVASRLPASASRARIALRALSAGSERERYETWFAPFTPAERSALLGAGSTSRPHVNGSRPPARAQRDALGEMLALDVSGWLADNLLERADRMSMASALEVRPPFLDRAVVELAFSLPSSVKVHKGTRKWIVKEVARRYLPDEIVDRRKVGFRVPLDEWFRTGLRSFAADRLLDPSSFVQSVLDRKTVAALVHSHLSGRRDEQLRIWTLCSLEVWYDVFFRKHAI